MQSKLKLQDYYKGQYCNEYDELAFAIEPEISESFYVTDIEDYYDDYTAESNDIYELTWLHHNDEEMRMRVYDDIAGHYKNKFPVGSDGHLSWWVHFVLFGDFEMFHHNDSLKWKLLNCPLFLKMENKIMYGREMDKWCSFDSYISYWSKGEAITLKDSLYTNNESIEETPIEFRCNNVFDDRLLWYYQWVMIAEELNVPFKKTSNELRRYARMWDVDYYDDEKWLDKEVSSVVGYNLTPADLIVMRYNIKIILKLLKDNRLENSAKALKEYCNENGIVYI